MSNQSQTTTNKAAEPVLCKMGCGFFGSNATGDCCSKCWRQLNAGQGKKGGDVNEAPATEVLSATTESVLTSSSESASIPMDVEETSEEVSMDAAPEAQASKKASATAASTPKKRKKKKASYKNMIAGMMAGNKADTASDIEREKESLRKVVGGGTFSKIDKI